MKIQLSQDEIAQAVRDYVSKGVTLSNGNQMSVDFSMGRGENGLSATIDVPYMGVATLPVSPVTPATVAIAGQAVAQAAAPAASQVTVQAADPAVADDAAPFPPAADEATTDTSAETPAADAAAPVKSLFSSPAQ